MKGNGKLMKASGILLVLTLITSCFVGGTFAKYVSRGEAADSARVAKWGVTISNGEEPDEQGIYPGEAFSYIYHGDVTNSVRSSDKVIAPGTSGSFDLLKIAGTPEVAVTIETDVTVEMTGDWVGADGEFYCPLQFQVNGALRQIQADSADEYARQLEEKLRGFTNTKPGEVIDAGTDLAKDTQDLPALLRETSTFVWKWPYEGEESGAATSGQNDVDDTYLGDIAAGTVEGKDAPNIRISFATTVTQVD